MPHFTNNEMHVTLAYLLLIMSSKYKTTPLNEKPEAI